jgi:hypothetical protein
MRREFGESIESAIARDDVALLRVVLVGPGQCLDGLPGLVRKDEHLREVGVRIAHVIAQIDLIGDGDGLSGARGTCRTVLALGDPRPAAGS